MFFLRAVSDAFPVPQALTTGDGIARWFGPYARVTPGEGGSVGVGWDPHELWDAPITVWEPQQRLQTVSEMPAKDGSIVRLAVDYYLEAHDGRVRVRLVHSGFDDSDSWDGYIDGLDAGWTFFLFNLKHALERHRGVARQQLSARFRTMAPAGAEHPVFGATGLQVQPPVGTLRPGDRCQLTLGGIPVAATVAVRHASRTIAFVVPAWNDALLFIEREGLKESHQLESLATLEARNPQITVECRRRESAECVWELVQLCVARAAVPGVKLVRSSHSIDILAPSVSKLAVVDALPGTVLRIGDRGRFPGNDFALLDDPLGLSVDEVSASTAHCWNLLSVGNRGVMGALEYLRAIRSDAKKFRIALGEEAE